MSRSEEGAKLLGHQSESEEEEEVLFHTSATQATPPSQPPQAQNDDPPPSYTAPQALQQQPATITPTPFTDYQRPQAMPTAVPVPTDEAPPDYFTHEAKSVPRAGKPGLAVQIQIDGRLVPGTVMEDESGRHMVYICQPQAPSAAPERPPPPKDYFLLSIISLLCCCAPLGIVALIKSLEVQRLYRRGDYVGAQRASRQAHSWGSAAVVFGATIAVIVFALKIYFAEFEQKHYYYY